MKKESLVIVDFEDRADAEEAFALLRENLVTETYVLSQACIVEKKDGRIETGETLDTGIDTRNDQAVGGMIGMLLGFIVSPLGMLIGWGMGSLLGIAKDRNDAAKNLSIVKRISDHLPEGMTVLLAFVQEAEEKSGFDDLFKDYKVVIDRYDAAELITICEKAGKFQKKMESEAQSQLAPESFLQEVEEKRDELKKSFEELQDRWNKRD